MRKGVTRSPRLLAVSSPRLKPSSKALSRHEGSQQSNNTQAINTQEAPLTMPVLPNKKDCMAGNNCGCVALSNEVNAPSTTPTTTPASNKRKVCCTPRANSKVSNTAPQAPAKAAPVKPRRQAQGPTH